MRRPGSVWAALLPNAPLVRRQPTPTAEGLRLVSSECSGSYRRILAQRPRVLACPRIHPEGTTMLNARRSTGLLLGLAIAALSPLSGSRTVSAQPDATRMLRSPTVSATHVAFAYANNIWVVERAGGTARRLTSFQGQTTNPKFSPDGRSVAFSGEYGGNTDVYVVPVRGRRTDPSHVASRRRTRCRAGRRTARRVLFASTRATAAPNATPRFWTVPAAGGPEEAAAAAARVPGQDLARRPPRRLPHEHVVGRGAAQLPRRAEPARLDRRPQDVRPRHAAVDRFEGRRSGVAGRHRLLHLGSRRRRQRLVLRRRHQGAHAAHEVHGLRRQGAGRRRRPRGVRAGRLDSLARSEVRPEPSCCESRRPATSPG